MPDTLQDGTQTSSERLRETGVGPAQPLDFVFVLRPVLMIPLWVFFAQGARLASHRGWLFETVLFPNVGEWLGILSITGILGGGYLLNQMVDVETDRINAKLFFLPRGIISMRAAAVELAVIWLVSLTVAFQLGAGFIWTALAALAFSVTYSAGPIRAKSRVGADVLWNAAGFGLVAALAGVAASRAAGVSPMTGTPAAGMLLGSVSGPALWSIGSYVAAVGGVTASTIVLDREGDERAGLRTTAVALGERGASLVGVLLLAAAAALGLLARDAVAVGGAFIALAFAVRAHARGDRASRIRANQLGVAAFGLFAALFSPYVLVLAALVVLGSRRYYRGRFGFAYPGPEPH